VSQTQDKKQAVSAFIDAAKRHTAGTITRDELDAVLEELVAIASHKDWWAAKDYPAPTGDELQARYMIHEEPDNTYALYLNVMKPGKKIVPHNHTTWACIAAVEGTESNYLYERTDDASRDGHATLKQTGLKQVGPGEGIALLADDIHAVRIEDASIRHLHMYGLALEKLDKRVAFDMDTNTCRIMSVGVQTRRSEA
jgi:predicted metal-dependent enzyme (double-stranded beta helix superfamily)